MESSKSPLPLVSVAVVTYNQKNFISECLESIIAQDYQNKELIIADDGSTDGTQEIIIKYAERYPNLIKLALSKKNRGITKNSNKANFACVGKYISWMGGDDIMLPGKLSTQIEYMEENSKCVISYHNMEVFNSINGVILGYFNDKNNSFEGEFQDVVDKGTFNCASSCIVRKSQTPLHGFDERIPYASDWLYWMQTLLKGGEIHYIDRVLGKYRRHENNITNSNFQRECILDHMNSCNILMMNSVQHSNKIMFRYTETLRSMRIYDHENYFYWTKLGGIGTLNIRSIISFLVSLLTLHKIKI